MESDKKPLNHKSGKMNVIVEYTSSFKPADTLFHKLNPVVKIIWFILITILILSQESLIVITAIFGYILITAVRSELKLRHLVKKLRWIIIFVLISIIINILFNAIPTDEEIILFYIWDPYLPVRRLAVYFALRTSLWVLALSTCGLIFMHTTAPQDIVFGVKKLGLGYKIAYSLMVGLRYIPLIQDQTRSVVIAQKARGLDSKNSKSFKQTLEMIKDRLVTSLILIFRNVESTAMSMELRGFGQNKRRTNMYSVKFTLQDFVFLVLILGILIFLLLYRFHLLSFIPPIPSLYSIFW